MRVLGHQGPHLCRLSPTLQGSSGAARRAERSLPSDSQPPSGKALTGLFRVERKSKQKQGLPGLKLNWKKLPPAELTSPWHHRLLVPTYTQGVFFFFSSFPFSFLIPTIHWFQLSSDRYLFFTYSVNTTVALTFQVLDGHWNWPPTRRQQWE